MTDTHNQKHTHTHTHAQSANTHRRRHARPRPSRLSLRPSPLPPHHTTPRPPKYNERLSRQYRCELPPTFFLTLPCSCDVHHLSGPLTLVLFEHSQDHGRLQVHISNHSLSSRLHVEHPKTCTHLCLTPHRNTPAHTGTDTDTDLEQNVSRTHGG